MLGPFDIGGPGSQACIVSALSGVTLSIGSWRSLWAHETRHPSFTLRARWSWHPIFGIARLPWEAWNSWRTYFTSLANASISFLTLCSSFSFGANGAR